MYNEGYMVFMALADFFIPMPEISMVAVGVIPKSISTGNWDSILSGKVFMR